MTRRSGAKSFRFITSYLKTVDMQRTKHGGSEAMPHTPTQADPRSVVARSNVEEDPGLKAMWQGYAFATDFREERGHAHINSLAFPHTASGYRRVPLYEHNQ